MQIKLVHENINKFLNYHKYNRKKKLKRKNNASTIKLKKNLSKQKMNPNILLNSLWSKEPVKWLKREFMLILKPRIMLKELEFDRLLIIKKDNSTLAL